MDTMTRRPDSAVLHGPPATWRGIGCGRPVLALALLLALPRVGCTGAANAAEASADDNLHQWQLRRLFVPTERERAHERKGNVYIYEGLSDREVDQALNQQFERIDYMLFLGTRRTDGSGAVLKNPDGQDLKESADCGP